jgi:hypothetical protein
MLKACHVCLHHVTCAPAVCETTVALVVRNGQFETLQTHNSSVCCAFAVCETTVALVVRKGNPRNIQSWDDLIQPGLQVIVANPKTAGVARWIFLALWGSKMKKGAAAAQEYITKVGAGPGGVAVHVIEGVWRMYCSKMNKRAHDKARSSSSTKFL